MIWFHWLIGLNREKNTSNIFERWLRWNWMCENWEPLITFWEPIGTWFFHLMIDWLDDLDTMTMIFLTFYTCYMMLMIFHTSFFILTKFQFFLMIYLLMTVQSDHWRWRHGFDKMNVWKWFYYWNMYPLTQAFQQAIKFWILTLYEGDINILVKQGVICLVNGQGYKIERKWLSTCSIFRMRKW